ncbi:MAG: phosphomannomutase/phosphoglucomutase [Mariprofundaceae bacterium]|nr:phosphomannomutase/phosphoglucomutase [Mariprofundaceae bacterium]
MLPIPHQAFREYDIRGIAGEEITPAFAYRLGRAFADTLPASCAGRIVVGRDARLSGPELQKALIRGLTDAGRDVLDIGMVPSPLAYFAVFKQDAAGCVMVTASHNPAPYNGFKLMRGKQSLHGDDIQALMQYMEDYDGEKSSAPGHIRQQDVCRDYHDSICPDTQLRRPLKVVIDAGNGPTGIIAAPLYRNLCGAQSCEVIELFCEPDGRFPNHHPDPTVEENLYALKQTVLEHKADLGIAFDGDGDRIGVVDEGGNVIPGDMLLLLIARDVLRAHPGATVISEVKSSRRLYADIRARGGRGIMWRTGHSPIKAKMKETGALLAGEMSGHIFFADRYYGFDDATYAGARLMQLLSVTNKPLSALLDDVPPAYSTPEIRVDCDEKRKFEIVEKAKSFFASEGYDIIDVDGMRLEFEDAWGLLRASNTQAALVLRFEAESAERLNAIRHMMEDWLHSNI